MGSLQYLICLLRLLRVVDVDQILCESTVSSLKEIGVDADWALDGESALEMVKKKEKAGSNLIRETYENLST